MIMSVAGNASQASIVVGDASKDRNRDSTRSRVTHPPPTWPCLLA